MLAPEATSGGAAIPADDRYRRIAAYTLLAVTAARLLWLAGNPIDLYPDEAQYWLWSLSPAWGYYSKPPLVAWIIAATTALFGEDEFGIRIASPLLHFATALLVFAIARRLYDSRVACWSAVLYATLPAVSVSAAIISTDVPLLFCWAAALYAFIRAREAGGSRWWVAVGLAVGGGLLAKYAMAYWLISALLFLAATRGERRHIPALLGAGGLALIIYAPNFFWNRANGFASYLHTRDNADLAGPLFHPSAFLEFAASQFGVFGPILFAALIVLALARRRALAEMPARLLACFALPTLAMMLVVSFLSRAQPNWSAPTYVSATVLVAAWLLATERTRLLGAALALHLAAPLLLVGGPALATALGAPLPAKYDLLHRVRGWHVLGREVAQLLLRRPNVALLSDAREDLAALVYYVRPHPLDAVIWNPGGGVHNQFDLTTDLTRLAGADFLYVSRDEISPEMAARFVAATPVQRITIPLGPGLARHYAVYDLAGFKGYR